MRKYFIAGNWKMNKTPEEAKIYLQELQELVKDCKSDVAICAPYIDLAICLETAKNTNITICAQNMHELEKGAFTGEVSPKMLKAIGINYVLIGHSERRQYYNETDEKVNLKLKSAFENELLPILCVGDTIEQRNSNIYKQIITEQVKIALEGLDKAQVEKTIIAYEPIWAISTSGIGQVATKEDADEACNLIRQYVKDNYGIEASENIRILYGGSVKPSNAKELFSMPNIDGALVGGASLKPEDFLQIVNYEK